MFWKTIVIAVMAYDRIFIYDWPISKPNIDQFFPGKKKELDKLLNIPQMQYGIGTQVFANTLKAHGSDCR
ncbi:MAG: hypothetical protein KGH64_02900 [Candidatus Micrarchaeota archaeon]|nr:hypothetical protein [Candidatus Micrarchaeota archaeon]